MRRRRRASRPFKISAPTVALVVVVAIVNSQCPPVELEFVQVPHCRGRSIDIGVFQESEAFRSACLLVVDETKVYHLAGATEDLANLLFTDACKFVSAAVAGCLDSYGLTVWDVADENHSSALLPAVCHLRALCRFVDSALLQSRERFTWSGVDRCYCKTVLVDSMGDCRVRWCISQIVAKDRKLQCAVRFNAASGSDLNATKLSTGSSGLSLHPRARRVHACM